MKKIVFLLICLCCFGFISAAYAQDSDDDSEDDDLYAPQQILSDILYDCQITHYTNLPGYFRKSLIMQSPSSGVKKIIYWGPFNQSLTFQADFGERVKIFSGEGITLSALWHAFRLNPFMTYRFTGQYQFNVPIGFEARARVNISYIAYDFNYTCTHRLFMYQFSGSGRAFKFSPVVNNPLVFITVGCRRVGSSQPWVVC